MTECVWTLPLISLLSLAYFCCCYSQTLWLKRAIYWFTLWTQLLFLETTGNNFQTLSVAPWEAILVQVAEVSSLESRDLLRTLSCGTFFCFSRQSVSTPVFLSLFFLRFSLSKSSKQSRNTSLNQGLSVPAIPELTDKVRSTTLEGTGRVSKGANMQLKGQVAMWSDCRSRSLGMVWRPSSL